MSKPPKQYGYKVPQKKSRLKEINLDDKGCVVRFPQSEYEIAVAYIQDIRCCQVCGRNGDLDHPHHARQGLGKKDDRFLVNICIYCHREIHSVGFEKLPVTREELEDIGWNNHVKYLEAKRAV